MALVRREVNAKLRCASDHPSVNRKVVSSIPVWGAKLYATSNSVLLVDGQFPGMPRFRGILAGYSLSLRRAVGETSLRNRGMRPAFSVSLVRHARLVDCPYLSFAKNPSADIH